MLKTVKKLWLPSSTALFVGAASGGGGSDPLRIQGNSYFNGGALNSSTCTVTLASPVASGNSILVVFGCAIWGNAVTVTDDKGNTYTAGPIAGDNVSDYTWCAFYCLNVTNAPKTITATIDGRSAYYNSIFATEFSNLASFDVSAFNANQTGVDTTNGITSTTATTTANGDLVWGACVNLWGNSTLTKNSAFTQDQVSGQDFNIEYFLQETAGSIAATWTGTTADHFASIMMAFKKKT